MFRTRQYLIELGSALAVYMVLLFGANHIEGVLQPQGGLLLAVNLLPMLGAAAGAWAIMRALWRMDEMQRRIQFDALAMAFLGTALITLGWGFAEGAGVPHLRAFAVWPIMGTLWAAAMAVSHRRYR